MIMIYESKCIECNQRRVTIDSVCDCAYVITRWEQAHSERTGHYQFLESIHEDDSNGIL